MPAQNCPLSRPPLEFPHTRGMLVVTARAPQSAGERLREAILSDLPPNIELDAREQLILDAAAEQADAIEALEADIRDRGVVVKGVVNSSVREARQGRLTMARLLGGLDMPDSHSMTELRGRRAANARWKERAA